MLFVMNCIDASSCNKLVQAHWTVAASSPMEACVYLVHFLDIITCKYYIKFFVIMDKTTAENRREIFWSCSYVIN